MPEQTVIDRKRSNRTDLKKLEKPGLQKARRLRSAADTAQRPVQNAVQPRHDDNATDCHRDLHWRPTLKPEEPMSSYEHEVPRPGEFIQEELDARGWSQRDLAYILNRDEPALNKLIKGRYGISPDMAMALARAFDVDDDFFANLQKA